MEDLLACQVPGCGMQLPATPYNTLHKICVTHADMPEVMFGGELQRWCHPCARFEMLAAFDGGANSCRASRRKRYRIDPSLAHLDAAEVLQQETKAPHKKNGEAIASSGPGVDRGRPAPQRTLSPACSADDIAEFRNIVGEWMKTGAVPSKPPNAAMPSLPPGPLPDLGSLSELGSLELDFPDEPPPPQMATPGGPTFEDALFFDRMFGNALTPGLRAVLAGGTPSPPQLPSPPGSRDLSDVPPLPSLSGQPSLSMAMQDPWAAAVEEAAVAAAAAAAAAAGAVAPVPPLKPVAIDPTAASAPGEPPQAGTASAEQDASGDVCDDLLKLFDGSVRRDPAQGAASAPGAGGGCWTVFVPGPLLPLQQARPGPPAPAPPPPPPPQI